MTTTQPITAEDLLHITDDGHRYELLGGQLIVKEPAGFEHGSITMKISTPLDNHVQAYGLGIVSTAETGFKLASNPDTVRAPDVAFVSADRIAQTGIPKGYWPGAPDLAVEVISPNDSYGEVEEKIIGWLEAGCRMVVAVNPRNRTATVYRSMNDIVILTDDDVLDGGDVVPGWSLAVRAIFD